MAVKKVKALKHQSNRRQPGEGANEWTVRTAYLVQDKKTRRWSIRYTDVIELPGGETVWRTKPQACLTTNWAEANACFAEWRRQRLNPGATGRGGASAMFFEELARRYTEDTRRDRFSATQERSLRPAVKFFEHDLAATITDERLNDYRRDMESEGRAPGTVRVRLSAVLAALRYGARRKYIPRDAVPEDPRLPPVTPARQYTLSQAEHALVFDRAAALVTLAPAMTHETRMALHMCIAAETAARKEAIMRLTWDRVSFVPGREEIDFRRPGRAPANKKAGVVPMSDRLRPVLRHVWMIGGQPRDGAVFQHTFRHAAFAGLTEQFGFPKLTPHVFRHTWATLAIRNGMPLPMVAQIMADDIRTIMRTYAHLVTDDARDAMRRHMTMSQEVSHVAAE